MQTTILGIESSCDETAAAVVADGREVLSSVVASQLDVHARYGGVVPELASREHLRAIVPVVREALENANKKLLQIDALAVTSGPGLVGSLLVGITYAKALSLGPKRLPLISVNHIEGHIHSVLLAHDDIAFPALALVVSGGHTHLFSVPRQGKYQLIGKTRDDAAGEAYDKVAKLLGYGYPGGPLLDLLAPFGDARAFKFTPPKIKGAEFDFSFSGFKTAVLRFTEQMNMADEVARRQRLSAGSLNEWRAASSQRTLDLIASFQSAVIAELLRKATAAAEHIGAETILISGGVASNAELRRTAENTRGFRFLFPKTGLSTDNAAMIAAAAFTKFQRRDFAGLDMKAQASLMLG